MDKKDAGFEREKLYVLPAYIVDELKSHALTRDGHITDIGYFPQARHHFRERPQGCNSHIFIYCASGRGWIQMRDQGVISMTEQSFAYIPMDVPHAYGADENDPWTIYWFHLRGEQIGEFIALLEPFKPCISLLPGDEAKLLELFHQCYDLLVDKPYSVIHQVQVSQSIRYLLSFVASVAVRKQDSKTQRYIDKATRYMSEHLESTITVEELSRHIQISKQHLNFIFKQSTSYSPIDYFLRMKMQRAGQLLDLTSDSIKEIAAALGFQDPYYFSRLFKKIIGCSPTSYRNQLKG
ncbi:AraC family transcriptional regulator [Paenibacillus kribbensis]|uniref:AraC family transcriptional regulator n=1 Tax=Paenibacillus kribbensis TaxID=172713 RepID=A0A222WM65_9BACL|nr:AraC family transcriptional regulator [Paenibacillus kribbensis]ASR47557.1 AraC family transcriptional regulator [Paenibacillus kribbensis]